MSFFSIFSSLNLQSFLDSLNLQSSIKSLQAFYLAFKSFSLIFESFKYIKAQFFSLRLNFNSFYLSQYRIKQTLSPKIPFYIKIFFFSFASIFANEKVVRKKSLHKSPNKDWTLSSPRTSPENHKSQIQLNPPHARNKIRDFNFWWKNTFLFTI